MKQTLFITSSDTGTGKTVLTTQPVLHM